MFKSFYYLGNKGIIEVLREGKAQYFSNTYGHIAVGGEVKIDVEGEAEGVEPAEAEASVGGGKKCVADFAQNVGYDYLFAKTQHKAAYAFGNRFNHEPKSMRKLLVHANEVEELRLKTEAKGLTLIPLKVYLKGGRIKVALGVCRGKALHDKRESLKDKAMRRDMERGA